MKSISQGRQRSQACGRRWRNRVAARGPQVPAVTDRAPYTSSNASRAFCHSGSSFVSSSLSRSLLRRFKSHCCLFASALDNSVICQMAVCIAKTSLLSGPVSGWHLGTPAAAKQVHTAAAHPTPSKRKPISHAGSDHRQGICSFSAISAGPGPAGPPEHLGSAHL